MAQNASQLGLLACVLSALFNGNHVSATPRRDIYQSYPPKAASPAKWSTNVLKEKVSVTNLNQVEPGFDLEEDEIKKFKLWPYGIISYYIDDLSYDKVLRDRIRNFLDITGGLTGLHFRELPSPPEDQNTRWVFFINRIGLLGCADHSTLNFTNKGVQKVTLGYNCMSEKDELAEAILAIVGVPPQHNSPDRDDYITVIMENILPEKRYLFQILNDNEWLFHELEYDFSSAGHFNFHKHTKDGLATITPKKDTDFLIGENNGFSYGDILKIHMLYNYMSKKKSNSIKAPECNKLFAPGNNFSKFKPDPKDEIPPRPKPNKYLGLPDNASNENHTIFSAEGESDTKIEVENKGSIQYDDNIYQSGTIDTDKSESDNVESSTFKFALKNIDPLTVLSDYDTDHDKQKVKSKRGKNNDGKSQVQ